MERREWLEWMVATGGLAAFNRLPPRDLLAMGEAAHRAPPVRRTLDRMTADSIAAAAALIIPATDTPGAIEAGVPAFIAHMLEAWHTPEERARFLAGVPELDTRAAARGAASFVEAPVATQVTILEALDDEVGALRRQGSASANAHWFAMLKWLTVWGYCTSEAGMRQLLHSWPQPMRYDGNAPVAS